MRQNTNISHSKFFLMAFKIPNKSEQVSSSHCLVPDLPNRFSNCLKFHLPRTRHRIVQHDVWINTRQHREMRKQCISNLGSPSQPPFPQTNYLQKPTSRPPLQKHSLPTNHPYQVHHDTHPHRTQRHPTHPHYTPSLPPTSPLRIPTPPPHCKAHISRAPTTQSKSLYTTQTTFQTTELPWYKCTSTALATRTSKPCIRSKEIAGS